MLQVIQMDKSLVIFFNLTCLSSLFYLFLLFISYYLFITYLFIFIYFHLFLIFLSISSLLSFLRACLKFKKKCVERRKDHQAGRGNWQVARLVIQTRKQNKKSKKKSAKLHIFSQEGHKTEKYIRHLFNACQNVVEGKGQRKVRRKRRKERKGRYFRILSFALSYLFFVYLKRINQLSTCFVFFSPFPSPGENLHSR